MKTQNLYHHFWPFIKVLISVAFAMIVASSFIAGNGLAAEVIKIGAMEYQMHVILILLIH